MTSPCVPLVVVSAPPEAAAVREKIDDASNWFSTTAAAAAASSMSAVVDVVSLLAQSKAPQYNDERDRADGDLFFQTSSCMDFRVGMTKDDEDE